MIQFLLATVPQLLVTGLMIGSIYALVALCYYVVHAGTGVINFAQGDFVVIGLVFTWLFHVDLQLPVWASLPLTIIATLAAVAVFERFAMRPVTSSDPMIPLLITLAGGGLIRSLIQLVWGVKPRLVPHYSGDDPIQLLDAAILPQALWIVIGTMVILLIVYAFFKHTLFGLSMLAAASDREGARVIGVNAGMIGLYSFGLSAMISGATAGLIAPVTNADPQLGLEFAIKGFAGAILGGIDKPHAAVVGGLLIGLFEALISGLISSEYRNLFVFGALMLTLVLRPQGLLGGRA
jgi:branched-chain amino acid transport system permease protein